MGDMLRRNRRGHLQGHPRLGMGMKWIAKCQFTTPFAGGSGACHPPRLPGLIPLLLFFLLLLLRLMTLCFFGQHLILFLLKSGFIGGAELFRWTGITAAAAAGCAEKYGCE